MKSDRLGDPPPELAKSAATQLEQESQSIARMATADLTSAMSGRFTCRVSDSGEGRWTIKAAIDEGVPAHVLSSALYERVSSRGEANFADKVLSAMRYQFGGHVGKPLANRAE
jgi:6-phosphogluconate dehydrogenase (decarboxylating)